MKAFKVYSYKLKKAEAKRKGASPELLLKASRLG
jgi:hypothetical protein